MTKFNNLDVDRVFAFTELLERGLTMDEAEAFLPMELEERERKRLVYAIDHCESDEYTQKVASDKFKHRIDVDEMGEITIGWRLIPMELLRELHMTICNRERAQETAALAKVDDEAEPF
jgi:hypothetical protein